MKETIGGKIYDTDTAQLIASDRYWDGSNFERGGRNTHMYLTKKGNYFLHTTTQWQGERDGIFPISAEEAMERWDSLPEKEVDWDTAFPHHPAEEA
jgi:hypothetical protein